MRINDDDSNLCLGMAPTRLDTIAFHIVWSDLMLSLYAAVKWIQISAPL